jgi:hypothetical protein
MSTRSQSDWGRGDVRDTNPLLGSSPSGASEELYGVLQNFVRLPGFGKMLVQGRAGDLSATAAGGIDMNRLNRSMLGPLYGKASGDYPITSLSFAEVDAPLLGGSMVCTGRPVRIEISMGGNLGSATGLVLSAFMDGVEVTGKSDGMAWIYAGGDLWISGWHVMTPTVGTHRFSLVAKAITGGSATIYTSTKVQMFVAEL